jgi:hypothetical protein
MKAKKTTKSAEIKSAAPVHHIEFSAFCVSVDDKWSKPSKRKKF